MSALVQSVVIGGGGVWIALLIGAGIGWMRRAKALASASTAALLAVTIQAAHFGEEFATGFHRRFFPLLGQPPWPDALFVGFNLFWLTAWIAAIAVARCGSVGFVSATLLWFLCLAAIFNGVAHPLLALAAGGYFPGVVTAPILGVAGLWLLIKLRAG